jgi:hypothetical protein
MSNDNHPPAAADETIQPGQDVLFLADERPWPPATGDRGRGRVYDHGIYWCDRRDYHPDAHAGYPHLDHYRTECRSHPGLFSTGRLDYAGEPADVEVYAARPFRYGQPTDQPSAAGIGETRLVLAGVPLAEHEAPVRFSLPITEARNLARHLHHIADVVNGYTPPWASYEAR